MICFFAKSELLPGKTTPSTGLLRRYSTLLSVATSRGERVAPNRVANIFVGALYRLAIGVRGERRQRPSTSRTARSRGAVSKTRQQRAVPCCRSEICASNPVDVADGVDECVLDRGGTRPCRRSETSGTRPNASASVQTSPKPSSIVGRTRTSLSRISCGDVVAVAQRVNARVRELAGELSA